MDTNSIVETSRGSIFREIGLDTTVPAYNLVGIERDAAFRQLTVLNRKVDKLPQDSDEYVEIQKQIKWLELRVNPQEN